MKPRYILLFFLLFLFSCLEDAPFDCTTTTNRNRLFELTDNDENRVSTIDILAFKVDENDNTKEYFAYKTQGRDIADSGSAHKKQFTASLLRGGNSKYRFVALANVRKELDALGTISTSLLKEDVLSQLIISQTSRWNTDNTDPLYRDMPMWGESAQMLVEDDTKSIIGINLVRNLSRIDVIVDAATTATFKLKTVRVYNYNTKGRIVPLTDATHWDGGKALKPSIPADNGRTLGPLLYTELSTPNVALKSTIYLMESAATAANNRADASCLVIGGEYNNSGIETFYRVDFVNSATKALTYLDLLRNYLYNVKIAQVKGAGYATPQEAFEAQAMNIVADVTVWDQSGITDVVFDGQYMLGVSKSQFTLPANQRTLQHTDNRLTIMTDYPKGWTIESITDSEGSFINAGWLTVNLYVGGANTKTTISLLTDANASGAERKAYINITAGRLKYTVEVIQSITSEISLDITDINGNEISQLSFLSHVGGTVPAQKVNLLWTPFDVPLFVSTSTVGTDLPFAFGTGDAIVSGSQAGVNGQKTYNIQPPAMTQAEINLDPFLKKSIRADYSVYSGSESRSKTLYLLQENYAAIYNTQSLYFMDGDIKTFTIRSNAPWRIEVTSNPSNIVQELITTTGGNNRDKTDETVSFRIIDDMTTPTILENNVTFTIKSANPALPFADIPVTIRCISAIPRKRLLTIGSDPNGFGYNFSGTAASNKLITSAVNYGTLTQSTVKSLGFDIINGGQNPTDAQLLGWLITNPVDIVIIGYDNNNISTTGAGYYSQFLANGGGVIAFQDRTDTGVSANFLKAVLNNNAIVVGYATGGGSIYQFADIDNKVLNGPFGSVRLLQWGEDASTTVRVSGVDPATVDMISSNRDISTTGSTATAGQMTAFMHKTLTLVWAGDGGFNSNNAGTDLTICPFKLDANNRPVGKASYGRGSVRFPVYNSVFTANAIYWAMLQSELKKPKTKTTNMPATTKKK